jgi:hypothetical protein
MMTFSGDFNNNWRCLENQTFYNIWHEGSILTTYFNLFSNFFDTFFGENIIRIVTLIPDASKFSLDAMMAASGKWNVMSTGERMFTPH